jgi:hypothetical protein
MFANIQSRISGHVATMEEKWTAQKCWPENLKEMENLKDMKIILKWILKK